MSILILDAALQCFCSWRLRLVCDQVYTQQLLFDQLLLILTTLLHADLLNSGYLTVCVFIRL